MVCDDLGMMSRITGRTQTWCGGAVAIVSTGGLAWYLASVGLDAASKWAGVLGLFAALAGVGVSILGLRRGSQGPGGAGQSVHGSAVGGSVTQITGAGHVRIHGAGAAGAGPAPAVPPADPVLPAVSAPPRVEGQSVTGSRVNGSVDQVSGAHGDVEIRRES